MRFYIVFFLLLLSFTSSSSTLEYEIKLLRQNSDAMLSLMQASGGASSSADSSADLWLAVWALSAVHGLSAGLFFWWKVLTK